MLHLYEINESFEVYAADSEKQALEHYLYLTGEEPDYIVQLNDDELILRSDYPDLDHEFIGKTYAEIANSIKEPCQIFSCYN